MERIQCSRHCYSSKAKIRAFQYCIIIAVLLVPMAGNSQGEIPVNLYTGTPQINIPLAEIRGHDLFEMVSIGYDARGVRPNQWSGPVGVSWNLDIGSKISREVRGLPDDFKGTGGDGRRGWLYTRPSTTPTIAEEIGSFAATSDNDPNTCTDETSDHGVMATMSYLYDTEPDIFHYSVAGYSGSFVFDNTATPTIRLIPFQDIQITPTFDSTSGYILKFTVKINTGVVHEFVTGSHHTRKTKILPMENVVELNKTEFSLYETLTQYYVDWKQIRQMSPSGDTISYVYQSQSGTPQVENFSVLMADAAGPGYSTHDVYRDSIVATRYDIMIIKSELGNQIHFEYVDNTLVRLHIRSDRTGSNYESSDTVRTIHLGYQTDGDRRRLSTITESGDRTSMPPYEFEYYHSYIAGPDNKSFDIWGYYNGQPNSSLAPTIHYYPDLPTGERFRLEEISGYTGTHRVLPGANRQVHPQFVKVGALKRIHYPMGGTTTLEYESNTYYDSIASQTYYGGGLRLKSVTYFDGINRDAEIKKTYFYNESNGESSGRLFVKPAFVIPTWKYKDPESSNENLLIDDEGGWSYLFVRGEVDLAGESLTQGSVVGYKQVTVQRHGAGFVTYEYHVPAPYGSASKGQWSATNNTFARSSGCADMKILANGAGHHTFPYAPDPNFDFERGLVKKKSEYADDSTLVRESTYTYQYLYKSGSAPEKVWGLRYQKFPNSEESIFVFGKYFYLTDVVKVPASETVKTYEWATATFVTSTMEWFYESAHHKLLTRTRTTAIDGSVSQMRIRYPLDYGTVPSGADEMSALIGQLQSTFRNGVSIEQYQTVQWPGETEKIVGGSVTIFDDFSVSGKILPKQILTWQSPSPEAVSSFVPSYIDSGTKAFTTDNNYNVVSTMLKYSANDKLVSAVGRSRNPVTTFWHESTGVATAVISNAGAGEAAFSDFELVTEGSFDAACIACDPFYSYPAQGGRTGYAAIDPFETRLSKSLVRGANTYRISGWYNRKTDALDIKVKIQNATKTTTYYNGTVTRTFSGSSPFEYFEADIPVDPGLTTFYVEIEFAPQGTISSSVPAARIDDISFMPEQATLTSTTYQFPFGVTSMTQDNRTTRTEYDDLGRVKLKRDKDGNVLERYTYHFNQQ